jgi:hypothetical protein
LRPCILVAIKTTLYLATLLLGLSTCSGKKDDPTTTDPFLGHWQSETLRSVLYDVTGKPVSDTTTLEAAQLDITSTTITFTSVSNGRTSTTVQSYTRSGESLGLLPASGALYKRAIYVRNLTPASFTMEYNGPRVSSIAYYVQSQPYHR